MARKSCQVGSLTESGSIKKGNNVALVGQAVTGGGLLKELMVIDLAHDVMVRATITTVRQNVGDIVVSGKEAYFKVKEKFKEFGISLDKYKVSYSEGKKIKETIEKYFLEVCDVMCTGLDNAIVTGDVHHLDLNSAFTSGIVANYPELSGPYKEMYLMRKENNGYYKQVLTNSCGYFQSAGCNFALAALSKAGINWTNAKLRELKARLIANGRKPILVNTDGIWYQGEIFHAEDEGTHLGQWKNDHTNCCICIKGPKSYQYLENNQVHTVCSGPYKKEITSTWKFGEIFKHPDLNWKFMEDVGYVENQEKHLF